MSDTEDERVTQIYVTRDNSHPITALEEKLTNLGLQVNELKADPDLALTAVVMITSILWDIMSCSPL
jgi:hypothetical protein